MVNAILFIKSEKAQYSQKQCTCCKRQEEPATYSRSAVLFELYGEVFPESVHILGMLVFYRLMCMVCGREGPDVEFKVRLLSQ